MTVNRFSVVVLLGCALFSPFLFADVTTLITLLSLSIALTPLIITGVVTNVYAAGMLTVLSGFISPFLLLPAITVLLYGPFFLEKHKNTPFRYFQLYLILWNVVTLVFWVDWAGLLQHASGASILGTIEMMRTAPPVSIRSVFICGNYLLLCALVQMFLKSTQRSEEFLRGLTHASIIAFPLILLQIINVDIPLIKESHSFWSALGRFRGSFSDPNSFGISAILLISILFLRSSKLIAYIWIPFAFFSGSRSFLLGGIFLLIAKAWSWKPHAVILLFSLGCLLPLSATLVPHKHIEHSLPASIYRIVKATDLNRLEESLHSRTVFWTLALDDAMGTPLFGSGPERFRSRVPVLSASAGYNLRGWTDNANSFYLQLICEFGLVGLCLLLCGCSELIPLVSGGQFRPVVAVMGILLAVGPHFEFTEVSVLFAFILSQAFEVRQKYISKTVVLPVFLIVVLGTFLTARGAEYGFWNWEQDPHTSTYLRWTTGHAQMFLRCEEKDSARLMIRAPVPSMTGKAQSISISSSGTYSSVFTMNPGSQDRIITIPCDGSTMIQVALSVDPVLVPKHAGLSEDTRRLGLQVFTERLGDYRFVPD